MQAGGFNDRGPEPERSLMTRASGALVWSAANAAGSRLGTMAIGIALARLLGPSAFGTYAVAYVALMAVLSFNELGVSLAIVRWPDHPRAIVPTVMTISTLASAALAVIGLVAAGPFSVAMGTPQAAPVVRVLFLTVFMSGVVATPAALLQREFRQRRRTLIDQVAIWVGALTSMGLAILGMGAMSLALGRLAGVVISGVMFIRNSPEPLRFGWDREIASRLTRFGLPLALASALVFLVGYADQMIVGARLGAVQLGFYALAVNVASWPINVFSQPLRSVAPAAFSRLQHDVASMREAMLRTSNLVAAITFPACFLLAGASSPVVGVVYGRSWHAASAPLAILAGVAAVRILLELSYDYLVVVGRSGLIMMIQGVWLGALVMALVAGTRWGLEGVAAAQGVVAVVVILPLYLFVLRREGVPTWAVLRGLITPLLGGVVVWSITTWLDASLSNDLLTCLASGGAALIVMGGLFFAVRGSVRSLRALDGVSAERATAAQ